MSCDAIRSDLSFHAERAMHTVTLVYPATSRPSTEYSVSLPGTDLNVPCRSNSWEEVLLHVIKYEAGRTSILTSPTTLWVGFVHHLV